MPSNTSTIKAGKIIDTIGSLYNSLTPSSKRISDYVLSNAKEVSKLSIAELSQIVNAGDATIIRFCRTLGFKGYQDFKMELAIELANHNNQQEKSIFDTDVTDNDNAEIISQKLKSSIDNVLTETINLLDFNTLEQVTEQLTKARAIYFFGVGSSGVIAESAKHKFMRIGMNVDALTNNHFMYMKATLLQPGDIAIGISHSGNSIETTKAIRLAKDSGALTVAITHNPRSDIGKIADYVLVNGNRQGKLQGDSIGTKVSQLFVLDLIYTTLVKHNLSDAQDNKQKTNRALKNNNK